MCAGINRRGVVNESFTQRTGRQSCRQSPSDAATATIDDAIEKLTFVAQVERGAAELDAGLVVPHDEVKRRFDELVAAGVIPPPVEQGDPFEDWPDIRLPRGTAKQLIDEDRGEN